MEAQVKVVPKNAPSETVRHLLPAHRPPPSTEDIRRQLGWGLIETERKARSG